MLVGSGSEGSGSSIALVDVALGDDKSTVAQAWLNGFASPGGSGAPFLVTVSPGVPVKPFALFVPKFRIGTRDHFEATHGPAHAGVALGILDAVRTGVVPVDVAERAFLICSVWVDEGASAAHSDALVANNRSATLEALDNAGHEWPEAASFLEAPTQVRNLYYQG